MKFLRLLKSPEPTSSATVREALAEATQAALAAGRRVEDLVEQRRWALLDDEAGDLDTIERQLQLAQRDADRADLAAAELKERLAAAEQAEQQAARDRVFAQAQQAQLRGVEVIAKAYPALAVKLHGLVRYFEAMQWDEPMVPFLRRCSCHRLELPPVLTLFRGGLAPAGELMRGLAWTPYPSTAARYAMACLLEREEKGEPIILRCRIPRERVLWRHALGERETLVDVADATIACADRPRIERLARRSLRIHAKGLRQWNAMNADLIREPERWNKVPE